MSIKDVEIDLDNLIKDFNKFEAEELYGGEFAIYAVDIDGNKLELTIISAKEVFEYAFKKMNLGNLKGELKAFGSNIPEEDRLTYALGLWLDKTDEDYRDEAFNTAIEELKLDHMDPERSSLLRKIIRLYGIF